MSYIVLFCVLSVFAIIEVNKKFDAQNRIFNLLIVVLMFFIGFRDGLGADYYRYEAIFNAINRSRILIGDDIGFCMVAFILKEMRFSTEMIFFTFAALSCLCMRRFILDMVKYRYVALLVFFSLYMIPLSFNAMAQGIATGIMLYSFRYFEKKESKRILFLSCIAFLFHFIGLILPVLYLVYLFSDTRSKRVWFLVFLAGASLGMIFLIRTGSIVMFLPGRIKTIYLNYCFNFPEKVDMISILARFVMLFFVMYGCRKYNQEEKKWFTIYLMGLALYFVLYINSLLSTRINLSIKITEIYLIPAMLKNLKKEWNRTILVLALVVFLGTVLMGALQKETVYPYRTRLFDMLM